MCCAARSRGREARVSPRFRPLLGLTLWATGLLIALMTGSVSAYVVLTGLYAGSRAYAALRSRSHPLLGPGGEGD